MDAKREKARTLRSAGKRLKDIAAELDISVATASVYCTGVLSKGKNATSAEKQRSMAQFRDQYASGTPIPEIASDLGIPASTLFDWRREMGLKRNSRALYVTESMKKHLSKALTLDKDGTKRRKAIALYVDEQLSTPEIAERLGISAVTVGIWLNRSAVILRKRPTERVRRKLSLANRGPKRPNWKGGVTAEVIRIRTSLEMRLARERCFERDGYTCRVCGQKGGKLNAHHVWPFQRYEDFRFELGNLLTLCKSCHDTFHKTAGGHIKPAIGPFFYSFKEASQRLPERNNA